MAHDGCLQHPATCSSIHFQQENRTRENWPCMKQRPPSAIGLCSLRSVPRPPSGEALTDGLTDDQGDMGVGKVPTVYTVRGHLPLYFWGDAQAMLRQLKIRINFMFCILNRIYFTSVQFSRSVMYDSLRPHGLQHTRPPCPSATTRACLNSCPSSRRCHPTISSSVVPFSSCLQSFPASGSFLVSQFFASRGQKYWSFSFSISPSSEYSGLIIFQDWLSFRTDFLEAWLVWSPCSPRDSLESSWEDSV